MSLKYKVVKQVFGFDKTGTAKYVAKSVTGEMLPYDKVCKQVCQICGLHRGIVSVAIGGLLDVMVNNLDMGHSVQLGEFGVLRPGIRSKAQNSEESASAQSIYRRKVNFTPGKMLKSCLNDVAITRVSVQDVDYTDGSSKKPDKGDTGDPVGGGTGGGIIDPDA